MPVLCIGGQSPASRLAGTEGLGARKQPKADYPQGRRNRYSLAWNCGFENVSKAGLRGPLGRALEDSDGGADYP